MLDLNRKGVEFFTPLVTLGFIFAMTFLFIAVADRNNKLNDDDLAPLGLKQEAVLSALNKLNADRLYYRAAARVALEPALLDTARKGFTDDTCGTYAGADLWNNPTTWCPPSIHLFEESLAQELTTHLAYMPGATANVRVHQNEVIVTGNTWDVSIDVDATGRLALPVPQTTGDLQFPVDDPYVTSCFGYRGFIQEGASTSHPAADFSGDSNTPVKAAATGRVILVDPSWGRIVIEHDVNGRRILTDYLHLSRFEPANLAVGYVVGPGQVIGYIGGRGCTDTRCSANAYEEHLHFGVIDEAANEGLAFTQGATIAAKNGMTYVNPLCYLPLLPLDKINRDSLSCKNPNKFCDLIPSPITGGESADDDLVVPGPIVLTTRSLEGSVNMPLGATIELPENLPDLEALSQWASDTVDACNDDTKNCAIERARDEHLTECIETPEQRLAALGDELESCALLQDTECACLVDIAGYLDGETLWGSESTIAFEDPAAVKETSAVNGIRISYRESTESNPVMLTKYTYGLTGEDGARRITLRSEQIPNDVILAYEEPFTQYVYKDANGLSLLTDPVGARKCVQPETFIALCSEEFMQAHTGRIVENEETGMNEAETEPARLRFALTLQDTTSPEPIRPFILPDSYGDVLIEFELNEPITGIKIIYGDAQALTTGMTNELPFTWKWVHEYIEASCDEGGVCAAKYLEKARSADQSIEERIMIHDLLHGEGIIGPNGGAVLIRNSASGYVGVNVRDLAGNWAEGLGLNPAQI